MQFTARKNKNNRHEAHKKWKRISFIESIKANEEFENTLWSNSAIFSTKGTITASAPDFSFLTVEFLFVSGSLRVSPA